MERKAKKNIPLRKRIQLLDVAFSRYIRTRHMFDGGYVKCYTCRTVKYWQAMEAGHFVGRTCLALRWDEENVRPQCPHCNHGGGMLDEFREALLAEGVDVARLDSLRHSITKLDVDDLKMLTKEYERKFELNLSGNVLE